MPNSLQPHGFQHMRLPCPSPSPGACSNSFPLSQWCDPTISSSVVPFFSCLQSFPALGSFLKSQLFTSGGQSTGASASAFSSVQSLSHVRLCATPWIAARQAPLFITNSRSSLRFMFIESVMPSNHLILCRPLLLLPSLFSSIRGFSKESTLFTSGGQITKASAWASVLLMNTQDWFPLELTGLISLQSRGLLTVFSNS